MSAGRTAVLGAALGVAAVVRYTVEIPNLTLNSETGLLWILLAPMLRARRVGTPTPRHDPQRLVQVRPTAPSRRAVPVLPSAAVVPAVTA